MLNEFFICWKVDGWKNVRKQTYCKLFFIYYNFAYVFCVAGEKLNDFAGLYRAACVALCLAAIFVAHQFYYEKFVLSSQKILFIHILVIIYDCSVHGNSFKSV